MKGASQIAPLGVRLPDDLKERIQVRAKENGRSMNAEIVDIIDNSFSEAPNQEAAYLQEMILHTQTVIDLKDQIIASQESTLDSLRSTVSSVESSNNILKGHIKTLEDHVKILESHVKILEGHIKTLEE